MKWPIPLVFMMVDASSSGQFRDATCGMSEFQAGSAEGRAPDECVRPKDWGTTLIYTVELFGREAEAHYGLSMAPAQLDSAWHYIQDAVAAHSANLTLLGKYGRSLSNPAPEWTGRWKTKTTIITTYHTTDPFTLIVRYRPMTPEGKANAEEQLNAPL